MGVKSRPSLASSSTEDFTDVSITAPSGKFESPKGLGIRIPQRRPSDSILQKSLQPLTQLKQERPQSGSSQDSDCSEDNSTSRQSSLTSVSTSIYASPDPNAVTPTKQIKPSGSNSTIASGSSAATLSSATLPHRPRILHSMRSSPNFGMLNRFENGSAVSVASSASTLQINTRLHSSETTLPSLVTTPRKPKLYKSASKSSVRSANRSKIYEEMESDNEIPEDSPIWNIPLAASSTSSLFASGSKSTVKKAFESSETPMPPSPLPAGLGFPLITTKNLNKFKVTSQDSFPSLSPIAKEISTFYEASGQSYYRNDLEQRKSLSVPVTAPEEISKAGLEDFHIISKEKCEVVTPTRPIWLPPKEKTESKKHEREFRRMIEKAGHLERKKNEQREQYRRTKLINDARLEYLCSKQKLTAANIAQLKKIAWKTGVPSQLRFKVYSTIYTEEKRGWDLAFGEKVKLVEPTKEHANVAASYKIRDQSSLAILLATLPASNISRSRFCSNLVCASLIDLGFTVKQSLTLLHILNERVFTSEYAARFNETVQSRDSFRKQLAVNYSDDLSVLNFDISHSVITESLPLNVYSRTFEILLAEPDDQSLLLALMTVIIQDYHFGWGNLQNLVMEKRKIAIDDTTVFFNKVYSHWKKLHG